MVSLTRLVLRIVNPSLFRMVREMNEDYLKCLVNNSGVNPIYMPRYFFHGTTSNRMPLIQGEGLKPLSDEGLVYLADQYRGGKMHAEMKTWKEGGKPVVLYFDRTSLPDLDIRVAKDLPFFRCFDEIPAEHLNKVGPTLDYLLSHPTEFR